MVEPSYEIFDHTADMGLRVVAPTREQLFETAVEGFYAMVGIVAVTDKFVERRVELKADDGALLFRDFLSQLLLWFERDSLRVIGLTIESLTDTEFVAMARAAHVDEQASFFDHEIKAITYHELALGSIPGGFESTVIVDI